MSTAQLLEQILDTSRVQLAVEMHTPGQTKVLGYARAYWALEDDLRQLAAHIHEGARP